MKSFLLFLASLFMIQLLEAQNIGIGTTTPNASSILDIKSSNKGVLLPRTSTTSRNAIANPSAQAAVTKTKSLNK